MKNWWNSLSTIWKILLIVGVLIVGIFIYDKITGGISGIESWWDNKAYQERMQKVEELSAENVKLREEKKELERLAVESKAKEAVFAEMEKNLNAKQKAELDKLNDALAEQDKEEAITAEPTDSKTRCERTKQKMLDRDIKSAKEINCNE
jgi:hypothetical protein